MDPIETLMAEHRRIERVLVALQAHTARLGAGSQRSELGRFVRLIREYADAYHHGKEEQMLFERMVEAGFSKQMGPVAVMLHEHDQGRALVRRLGELAARRDVWTDEEAHEAHAVAGEYAALLSAHIGKEDQVLYPMARRLLSAESFESLGSQFAAHQRAHEASEKELVALAEELDALA